MPAEVYHYPPDLFAALADAIPLICRGKKDVLTFFRGAGVDQNDLVEFENALRTNRDAVKKHEVTYRLLMLVNEKPGNDWLRIRREIVKRAIEFNNFEACWPDKQFAARGAVAKVRELRNEKDAFTRIQEERDRERREKMAAAEHTARQIRERAEKHDQIRAEFAKLFTMTDPYQRAKAFERVLNDLFTFEGLSVRDAFTLTVDGSGIVEQIDGVIEDSGDLYLVEAKWWSSKLGTADVSQHMVRVFQRDQVRGIFVVDPGYTETAVLSVRKSLAKGVFVLCTVEELFRCFDAGRSVGEWLKRKIRAAIVDGNPWHTESPTTET